MEQLQDLLKVHCHRLLNIVDYDNWVRQYFQIPFPSYWQQVFKIANSIPRESRVLEIGAGYGMVTSIFVYLGYLNIISYEEDATIARLGNVFMDKVFGRRDIIKPSKFNTQSHEVDVLILVNCAYSDGCKTKEEYMRRLSAYYTLASEPEYYILEVIDSEYTQPNECFPEQIRLSENDIRTMFPNKNIKSWKTYEYPKNKKSKTLYLIQNEECTSYNK